MILLCKVGDVETAIVGYTPSKNGPQAICPWRAKDGTYTLRSFPLNECQILNLPQKLKKRLNRLDDIRHKHALKNTEKLAREIKELAIDPNNPSGQVLAQ